MFDHVAIRVADLGASARFYRTTLGAIGIEPSRGGADRVEWGEFVTLAADREHPPTRDLHLGFVAPSRVLDPDGTSVESVFRERG